MKDLAKILTKPYLIKEYIDNKKSILTIAKEIGCSKATILNYLKKYNINRRTISECLKGRHKITKLSNI